MDRSRIATDTEGAFLGDLKPGTRVGDYTIEATMSARGTGVVYRATHLVLPRVAAIKVMPALQEWSRTLATQLLREACILEAIEHPGVARIYECGVLADKRPWVASELVEGATFADQLSRLMIDDQKFPAIEIVRLLRDVTKVLEYTHRRGLIHCNLGAHAIVTGTKRFPVTITDWASARAFDSDTPVPLPPQLPARPHTAPEQRIGGMIGGGTDIYALGVAAYRALYGTFPDSVNHPPTTDIPPMLATLIAEMLRKNPLERPSAAKVVSAAEFVLAELADGADQALEQALADIDTGDDTAVNVALPDVPSSGVPGQLGDLPTAPIARRLITSEQVPSIAGEIDLE